MIGSGVGPGGNGRSRDRRVRSQAKTPTVETTMRDERGVRSANEVMVIAAVGVKMGPGVGGRVYIRCSPLSVRFQLASNAVGGVFCVRTVTCGRTFPGEPFQSHRVEIFGHSVDTEDATIL